MAPRESRVESLSIPLLRADQAQRLLQSLAAPAPAFAPGRSAAKAAAEAKAKAREAIQARQAKADEAKTSVIPAGSVIAPPKHTDFLAAKAREKKWFARLATTTVDDLVPGDVLILKEYDDPNPAVEGQRLLSAERGSCYSAHAALYLGMGKCTEMLGKPGLQVGQVRGRRDYLVYRPTSPKHASSAADVGMWFCEESMQKKHIAYSIAHGVGVAFHNRSFGPEARRRAAQVARREVPSHAMMCSELVTYCFQGLADDAYVRLDALRTAPMHLEDFCNAHPDRFRFTGVLRRDALTQAALDHTRAHG